MDLRAAKPHISMVLGLERFSMSDIWIYRRRPSSLVRYRHGGAAAFDPAMRSPLAGATVYTGTGAALAPAAQEDEKILHFPAPRPAARPKRGDKPGPRRPKPPKPKTPKKRDG